MATAIERKFTGLRKRLDQLGYRQPLGVESVPLVERIFNDLLHTTESLRNAKLQMSKNKEQKGLWEKQVEPYQQDNSRLTQENINLHQQIMQLKESLEQRTKELKANMRRLEHENTDLKFLNNQYMQRLLTQEKESQAKSERILELQDKTSQSAVIQTPGGRKRSIPFQRQRMEMDSALPPAPPTSRQAPPPPLVPDPQVVDLLKMADERVTNLLTSLALSEKEKKELEESIHELRRQLERRENEIERLAGQLRGGRPPEALAMEGKIESNERMVAHLNMQVDFLQQANQTLETELAGNEQKTADLQSLVNELTGKNSKICSELQEIGVLVKEMEKEREESENCLKCEVERLLKKCEELRLKINSLEEERDKEKETHKELLSDNKKMAELLSASQSDADQAAELIEKLSKENGNFKKQIQQLKSSGLETASGGLEKLRKERDQLKQVVKNFEAEMKQIQQDTTALAKDRDNIQLLYSQVNEELNKVRLRSAPPPTPPSSHFITRLEGERDDARLEVQQLRTECQSLRERLTMMREGGERVTSDERYVSQLQEKLQELSQERDHLRERSNSLRQSVTSLEKELEQSTSALSASQHENKQLSSQLKRIQGQLEAAEKARQEEHVGFQHQISESEIFKAEVTTLKLKITQLEEQVEGKQIKLTELQESLKLLDQERDGLRQDCDRKDEEIVKLQNELNDKTVTLGQLEGHMTGLKSTELEVHNQLTAKDKEVTSLRQQLSKVKEEIRKREEESALLTSNLQQLKQDLATMTTENQTIHEELRKVVSEKENMVLQVRQYSETVIKYQEELALKEQERVSLVESYHTLAKEAERLDTTVQKTKSQQTSLDLEISALVQENNQLKELCQQQANEITQHLTTLKSYEVQLSNLTHGLSKMEHTIRQEQDEKKALIGDLTSVRALCVQLDKTKESLSRQLASVSVIDEQRNQEIIDIQSERDLFKQKYNSELSKVSNLEMLLSKERRKEFQAHVSGEEKETELNHLRQQLTRLENDNMIQRDQLKRLQSDLIIKREQLVRLTTENTTLALQKQETDDQLIKLRSTISSSTFSNLSSPPKLSPPKQTPPLAPPPPVLSIASSPVRTSLGGGVEEAFTREEAGMKSESARLVNELLSQSLEKE